MTLSPRHEKFCHGIAAGKSATQAYIEAGYSENGAGQSGERLLKNADVSKRIKELRQESEKSMEFDRMDYLETLKERFLTLSPNDPVCARYGEMLAKAQGWNEPVKIDAKPSKIVVTIGGKTRLSREFKGLGDEGQFLDQGFEGLHRDLFREAHPAQGATPLASGLLDIAPSPVTHF